MSGACFRLLLSLGLTAIVTSAGAQTKKAPKFAVPGSADSASMGNKDARGANRARRGAPRADAAVATFPGFRLLPDGRSRIYVELSKSVSVDERRAEGMVIYVLRDARVPVRNNRNALITTHFATPVGRARLLSAGPDVELVIDLRKAASASQKVVAGDNGGARLEVDFPAGDYPPAPGLYDPPAAKGNAREGDEPQASESPPVQGGVSQGAGAVASPADAPRAAPSAAPTMAPAPPAVPPPAR